MNHLLFGIFSAAMATSAYADLPAPDTFQGLSANVFQVTCVSCHKANSPSDPADAKIDLSSYAALTASNQNPENPKHAPFIIPGDPEHSKLYLAVSTGKMPQTEEGDPGTKLSDDQIQNIYDWIKAGAQDN